MKCSKFYLRHCRVEKGCFEPNISISFLPILKISCRLKSLMDVVVHSKVYMVEFLSICLITDLDYKPFWDQKRDSGDTYHSLDWLLQTVSCPSCLVDLLFCLAVSSSLLGFQKKFRARKQINEQHITHSTMLATWILARYTYFQQHLLNIYCAKHWNAHQIKHNLALEELTL